VVEGSEAGDRAKSVRDVLEVPVKETNGVWTDIECDRRKHAAREVLLKLRLRLKQRLDGIAVLVI
jgi:hypothetical protein